MELLTITRLHRASGLALLSYLAFHAWEHWPVRVGRGAVMARLQDSTNVAAELLLVGTALIVHAWMGALRARAPAPSSALRRPFRKLEAASGLLSLAFVLHHALGVWLPRYGAGSIGHAIDALQGQAGTLPGMVLYVFGVAAVCTYVGLALLAESAGRGKVGRGVAVALAVMLYLVFVNELSAYASGASLL
jgi:hypothetical protein